MEDVVNIFSVVVADFAVRGVPDFHLGKSVACWESVVVDESEKGFYFRGNFCFSNPTESDELALMSFSQVPASML